MRRLLPPSSPPRFVNLVGGRGQAILPCRVGFPGQSPSPEAHVAAVRGLPSFRSRARGCSEGISWQPLRWSLVSWSWIWVSARRHNGAVALAEMFPPLGVPAFSFARGGRQLTRGHGGEREDGVEARSRAAVRARGRRGKDPKEHERSDVGVSTPRFPQALNSPVPPVWTSWGGGASYRALLIVAQTLITQPPWRISSLFDDNDTTLGSWNCAATKSPCYRATISTAPHKSRNLPRSTFLMAHVLI